MKLDKEKIYNIILNSSGKVPELIETLEKYVEGARIEAVGWTFAHCCVALDEGKDIRHEEVSGLIGLIETDLQTWEDIQKEDAGYGSDFLSLFPALRSQGGVDEKNEK